MEEIMLRIDNGMIVNNLEDYEKSALEQLKSYNYIVTEENYDQAKSDVKVIDELVAKRSRNRIDFEKDMLSQWNPIKERLMSIEKKFTKQKNDLKDQMNIYDEREKEKKKALIKDIYDQFGIDIPFENILDVKWLNKSCSNTKWKKELDEKVVKIKQDIELIGVFSPQDKADAQQVYELYRETLDIGLAKQKADRLIELRNKVQESEQKQPEKEDLSSLIPPVDPVVERVDFKQELEVEREEELTNEEPKKIRYIVEFVGSREFFDYMNQGIIKYRPSVKVIKKEEL